MTSVAGKVYQPTKDPRIKKRGDWYWARFQKRGVEVCESLHTQSFQIAVRLVEEIESCILLGVDWKKEQELFETAWPEFLIDKARGNKTKVAREKTLHEYTGFGERYFLPHFQNLRVTEINEEAWEKFVEDVRKSRPDMLFFNPRKYLMGFLSWAKRKGKIREMPQLFDPDAKAKAAREEAGPGRAFTLDELTSMRKAAAGMNGFYLFMLMMQYMGMRPSEVTQLKLDRIDLDRWTISLRKADTKTHRARVIPVHPEVRHLLAARVEGMRSKSAYLFPNRSNPERPMDKTGFKKRWAEVAEKAGLDGGRIYDFRHTFITHAITAGVNPAAIAVMTGTSIAVIQKHYLHMRPEDLQAEIEKVRL